MIRLPISGNERVGKNVTLLLKFKLMMRNLTVESQRRLDVDRGITGKGLT